MSTERLIVDEAVADEFVSLLGGEGFRSDCRRPEGRQVLLVPWFLSRPADRMVELIDDAVTKGAVVVAGGGRTVRSSSPTLIDMATPEMRIYEEESFGPVKAVFRVSRKTMRPSGSPTTRPTGCLPPSLAAASLGFPGGDTDRNGHLSHQLPDCQRRGPGAFRWCEREWYGRFGGKAVVDQFTVLRWITIEDPGQHYPF